MKLGQGEVRLYLVGKKVKGKKLPHLILAEGEVTGHSHRITAGKAELIQAGQIMYLIVKSKTAKLTHEEHGVVVVPQGTWEVRRAQEWNYDEEEARQVRD